jgi:peptide/nickel transport system substrate-binding protein/oligopeptide transport system substrate-binding protein
MPAAFAAVRGVGAFIEGSADEIEGLIVHSDDRFEIRLQEPLPIYPALLTDNHTGIVGTAVERTVGTGPFLIVSHSNDRIELERNPDHWRGTGAALDAIEFRPGLSAGEIAEGLRSGELDLSRDLLPEDLEETLRDPRFRGGLVEAPKKNTYFIVFNSCNGPAARDPLVRRALCGIVRTRDLVWQTLGRFAQPASCLIPPGMLGHDPGKRRQTLTRDEALDILRSVSLSPPFRLNGLVHPLIKDRYGSLLTSLLSIWSELGVEVSIKTSTMASYREAHKGIAELDVFVGRWNADYDDPDDFTHKLFHSRAGLFRDFFASADADQILEEARAKSRPGVREALYRKFENLLQESGVLVPLFHDVDYRIANPRVRGLKLRSTAPYVNYSEVGKVETTGAAETIRSSGGVLQVPLAGLLNSLDPSLLSAAEQGETIPSIFETLTRDTGGARIVPWLAAQFRMEDGGRRYRFRLHEDVRFHDGRRLTARDVRYSFERLLANRDSECRWFYSQIRGAKALLAGQAGDLEGFRIHSADEFTIQLEEPVSFFPVLLSFPGSAIVPEGCDQFTGSWQEGTVGTGPFRVLKFDPGRRLELERNKTYWRKGYPRIDGLVFSFGVSPAEILTGFRAGRFSLASDLFPEDVEALRREPTFASGYRETPRLITYYVAFNTHSGPLSDKRLRQGLVGSVDVPALVRRTLGRLAVPAHGLIPPGLLGHDPASGAQAAPTTAEPPAEPSAEIELTAALNPVYFGEYAALIRELSNAFSFQSVKVRPVNRTMAEFAEARTGGTVDLVVTRWIADYPDADTFVHLLHSKEGYIGRFCGTPEIDRLIEKGRGETSPALRHLLYREIEEIIARDALLLPLFHEQTYRFARPEVEGLAVSYGAPAVDYPSLRVRG